MKLRIIEYEGQLFVVVGITNLRDKVLNIHEHWECFEAYPLSENHSIIETILMNGPAVFIKIEDAREVTERNRLESILVLYG